ncbi:hypothetical protein LSTR_LSTR016884 [Laodelphax striatellus]|uniref:Uncharacterized protein n=1 Tax=Laodelphax striatellus TaxID=195883 RepID=A0A482WIT8_LAOST|nr:hypothetical protein LSTR_LSTR016884 [Laodelphax striatellus]
MGASYKIMCTTAIATTRRSESARGAQEKSRAALQRYLFYCNRYMNHMQSLQVRAQAYASVKEKMEEMQQHNMSWIEVG